LERSGYRVCPLVIGVELDNAAQCGRCVDPAEFDDKAA